MSSSLGPPPPHGVVRQRSGSLPGLTRLGSSGPPPAQRQRTERAISQELAKEWFRDEVHSKELGAGGYGETRTYEVQDAEYRAALGPVVVVKHFEDGDEEADMEAIRELAKREHDAHHAAWDRMPPDCRQYLAQPAMMSFEDDPNVGAYLVQTLVGEEGLTTMSWGKFNEMLATTGAQLDRADKVWIAQSFGDMLGCIANARMVHKDFNPENVLVLTNFGEPLRFEWRLIDWGIAEVRGQADEALDPELCSDDLYGWEGVPGFRFARGEGTRHWACHGEKPGVVRSLYLMLRGSDVLDADVAKWIREGFAAKTGLLIPPSLAAAHRERQAAEEAARARA